MSGVPVVVQYLAEGLLEKGYDVSICTKWYEGLSDKENINGIHVYRFRLRKTLMKRYVGEIDSYRKFVLSLNADVVIFEKFKPNKRKENISFTWLFRDEIITF